MGFASDVSGVSGDAIYVGDCGEWALLVTLVVLVVMPFTLVMDVMVGGASVIFVLLLFTSCFVGFRSHSLFRPNNIIGVILFSFFFLSFYSSFSPFLY